MLAELFRPVTATTPNNGAAKLPVATKNYKPTVSIVTVTPEMATRWLSKNIDNRRVSPQRAKAIHDDMAEGAFQTTGQGITLGYDECLIDGQKRLMGIVSSGVAVDLVVFHDERLMNPRGAMIDRPEVRTEAYILDKNERTIAAARCIIKLAGSNSFTGMAKLSKVVSAIEGDMDALLNAIGTQAHTTTRAPIKCAILTLAHGSADADAIRAEYRAFVLNHPDGMSSPVRQLRDWMIRNASMKGGGRVDMELFVRTYTTFNPARVAKIARRIHDLDADRVWAVALLKQTWGLD